MVPRTNASSCKTIAVAVVALAIAIGALTISTVQAVTAPASGLALHGTKGLVKAFYL